MKQEHTEENQVAEWSRAAGAGPGSQQAWQELSWHERLVICFRTSEMMNLDPGIWSRGYGKNMPVLFLQSLQHCGWRSGSQHQHQVCEDLSLQFGQSTARRRALQTLLPFSQCRGTMIDVRQRYDLLCPGMLCVCCCKAAWDPGQTHELEASTGKDTWCMCSSAFIFYIKYIYLCVG